MASAICVRIAWFALLSLPLTAADESQLLGEFRKTMPDVMRVYVLAEEPLLVALTGTKPLVDQGRNARSFRAPWGSAHPNLGSTE